MSRMPRYGELQSKANHEAYLLWLSREEEPELLTVEAEPEPAADLSQLDLEIDCRRVYRWLQPQMGRRDWYVLHCRHALDLSFEDIAATLDLTRERVRQIELRARRRAMNVILGKPIDHSTDRPGKR